MLAFLWFCFIVADPGDDEEAKPKKKTSKKKKKSKAASKSSSKAAPKAEEKVDLSTAILGGAAGRNAMHVFSYTSDEGHSVVGMTEGAMEAAELFEGDIVSIKGKRGKKTILK